MGRGAFKVSARTLGTPIGIMVTDPLRRAAAWRGDSCAARKAAAGAISSVSSAWKSMVSADTRNRLAFQGTAVVGTFLYPAQSK